MPRKPAPPKPPAKKKAVPQPSNSVFYWAYAGDSLDVAVNNCNECSSIESLHANLEEVFYLNDHESERIVVWEVRRLPDIQATYSKKFTIEEVK